MKKTLIAAGILVASGTASAYDIAGIDITLGSTTLGGAFDQSLFYEDLDGSGTIEVENGEVSLGGYGFISQLFVGADINNSFDCDVFGAGGQCEIVFSFGDLVLSSAEVVTTPGPLFGSTQLLFDTSAAYLDFYLLDANATTIDFDIANNNFMQASQDEIEAGLLYLSTSSDQMFVANQFINVGGNSNGSASAALEVDTHAGAGWYFDTNQFGSPMDPFDINVSTTVNQSELSTASGTFTYDGSSFTVPTFAAGVINFSASVSEPGTLAILGSVIFGAAFAARRRKLSK